jgi:predicted enzyme related to lactoylglutathione lyase
LFPVIHLEEVAMTAAREGVNEGLLLALDHVLMFVPSVRTAVEWYATTLQMPATFLDDDFAIILVGTAQLCFHPADSKVAAGRAGQVAYWRVASLAHARARFETSGAHLYRGPLRIGEGIGICQFADPFGNLIGLVGPHPGD